MSKLNPLIGCWIPSFNCLAKFFFLLLIIERSYKHTLIFTHKNPELYLESCLPTCPPSFSSLQNSVDASTPTTKHHKKIVL
jgi:hypothetical protein